LLLLWLRLHTWIMRLQLACLFAQVLAQLVMQLLVQLKPRCVSMCCNLLHTVPVLACKRLLLPGPWHLVLQLASHSHLIARLRALRLRLHTAPVLARLMVWIDDNVCTHGALRALSLPRTLAVAPPRRSLPTPGRSQ